MSEFQIIECTDEDHIPIQFRPIFLRDVGELLPQKQTYESVWRWASKGRKGVKLRCIKLGDSLATSRAALTEFMVLVAEAEGCETSSEGGE